jgi:hypothetical protein
MKPLLILLALLLAPALRGETAEFVRLDNGEDLTGWSGDPQFWSVQDGAITGRSTAARPARANTFLIWLGSEPANFELRAEFRISGERANSGIQYRSRVFDEATWVVGGYQADMDVANQYTGMLYEERGRGIMVRPGERIRIGAVDAGGKPVLTPSGPAVEPAAIKAAIRAGEWNEIVITADGNHLRHTVNGILTAEAFDLDPEHAAAAGVIALQLHTGPPMTVQFRNIRLKPLP